MSRKWAYKPGEVSKRKIIKSMNSQEDIKIESFLKLSDAYTEANPSKRTMVLNDNLETVFFLQIGSSFTEAEKIDVYVWDGYHYLKIPDGLARKVYNTYFEYVDTMSEVYEALGGSY